MAIKLLKQNLEYFKSSNNIIKSSEIDTRFNDIVNYLNTEIIFNLNKLNNNVIIGSLIQSDINSILKSNSDIGYLWKKINNDDFSSNVIDIRKLNYKITSNSIFISSYNGNVQLVENQNTLNNIAICNNQGVKFDRIDSNYIDPSTKITGNKIKYNSITLNNLRNIIPTVSNNSIIGSYFKQQVITTEKIINNSITLNSFNSRMQDLLTNYIWGDIIPKNFINLNSTGIRYNIINKWDRNFLVKMFDHVLPISHASNNRVIIPIEKFDKFRVKNIVKYYTHFSKETDLSLTDPLGKKVGAEKIYILSPNNFKPNSINPNRLICWFNMQNNEKCLNINDIIANNTLSIDHFTPTIKTKIG